MRLPWIIFGVALFAACSSSSSRSVEKVGVGGDGGDLRDRGGLGEDGRVSDAGAGADTGADAGADAAVSPGPIVFEPGSIELRAGGRAEVVVRLQPGQGFQGPVEVTVSVESAAATDGGPAGDGGPSGAALSLNQTSFVLSDSHNEEPFEVIASMTAPQGAFVVRATATPNGSAAALSATLPVAIIGKPGELDTTFGNGGYVDYQPEGNCNAQAVVALADGRFLMVGQALTSKMLIARFGANGEIDTTFGADGSGRLLVDRNFGRPSAVLLSDGALLVAFDDNSQIHLTRVLPNGTLDSSFASAGFLQTDISPTNGVALAIDARGSILLGGSIYLTNPNRAQPVVRRLRPDGALDTTFAGDGTVEISVGTAIEPVGSGDVEGLAIHSNGNIVAAGSYFSAIAGAQGGDQHYAFSVQSNGQPDSAFGPGGVRRTKYGMNEFGNYEGARAVVIQHGGANADKVLVAGYYRQTADTQYLLALARHGANGSLDGTFLTAGKGTHNLAGNIDDIPGDVILEPDDGLIVQVSSYSDKFFVAARFTANGALDTAWGNGGIATLVPGSAYGMTENGRHLLVVGSAQGSPDPPRAARIARYWLR